MRSSAFSAKAVESIGISAFEFAVFPLLIHCTDGNTFSNLGPPFVFGMLIQAL